MKKSEIGLEKSRSGQTGRNISVDPAERLLKGRPENFSKGLLNAFANKPRGGLASLLAGVLSLSLAACGGSSGDSDSLFVTDDPNAGRQDVPVGSAPNDDPSAMPDQTDVIPTDRVYPYRPNGEFAEVLKGCALIATSRDACTLQTLPFIAQSNLSPTIDEVMDRVLVTHEWMGRRFEEVLAQAPTGTLSMFSPITSIVIGSTVRPSSYWIGTGGIRLDPERLWLSVAEKRTVSIEEDYRSGYGADLQFLFWQSRRRDGVRAYGNYELDDDSVRTLDDIMIPTIRLLYHELAHANDYLPPNLAAFLDTALTPVDALVEIESARLSTALTSQQPLTSGILRNLARVRFRGDDASDDEKMMDADFVGSEMSNDGAAVFYSYSTVREDFATLVENALMKATYDVDLYVAYVQKPADPDSNECSDFLVSWGSRNRIASTLVIDRARTALISMFGSSDSIDEFFADLQGTEESMTPGLDWCSNLAPETILAGRNRSAANDGSFVKPPLSDYERHIWAEQNRTRNQIRAAE